MAEGYGTRAALKERLELPVSDTSRDSALDSALAAASRSIDRATGRHFGLTTDPVTRTYNPRRRVVDRPDGELLLVNDIGSTTGLVVENGSGSTVTGFETSPDNALADELPITGLLLLRGSWGTGTARIRVTARFGWPSVPDDVAEAALIQAARLYRRRNSPEGVTGSAEWGVVRLSRRDPDVWNLIEPYVLPGFG
ncbi:phage gp6-like head-tail connector protein [Streptomyces globisporus]|uniref:phage gp6-like head-tail connector protein n=1 Tax=Streptomyces globisporus TaxID=1908 RepID=UPI003790E11A|nr:phage gp6-like head-tail connector protein [Streptomyces globisporus]WSU83684.1 phage gp6-like head-tail connector protein [Streptomyces globisporus]